MRAIACTARKSAWLPRGLTPRLRDSWVRVRSTEVAITNRRVIAKFGFIKRHTVEINLEKVEALRVEQGFWGRLLNYGTIFVSGAGSSVAPFPDIADPLVFRRKFMEATSRPLTRQDQ